MGSLEATEEITKEKRVTFAHLTSDGVVEIVDVLTGEVVAVQHEDDILKKVQTDCAVETLEYSKHIGDLICQKILEGNTFIDICEQENMPSLSRLSYWRSRFSDFAEDIKDAIKFRADFFHDKVISTANSSGDSKIKIDAYKWAADKGNPEVYGNKTKIIGDPNAPLNFIIDTGIRRPGDPGYTDTLKEVHNAEPHTLREGQESEKEKESNEVESEESCQKEESSQKESLDGRCQTTDDNIDSATSDNGCGDSTADI